MNRPFVRVAWPLLLVAWLASLALPSAPTQATPARAAPDSRVLSYLYSISGSKTISGQHNREPNSDPDRWSDWIYSVTGSYPGLWGGDFLYLYDDVQPQNRWAMINEAKEQWRNGALVSLTWHVCPPNYAEHCDWVSGVQTDLSDSQWSELVTDGSALNRQWKARLDTIVPYLQDLKNNGVEVLWRPLHEMNDGWCWWCGRPGANGSRRLYQITYDYLTHTKGLTNLVWVWNVKDVDINNIGNYYPGDSYVDVVSLDIYMNGFSTANYNAMLNIARGKPIAIGECEYLPSPSVLAAQPRWTWFLGWAELVDQRNSDDQIRAVYRDGRVLNRGGINLGAPASGDLARGRPVGVSSVDSAARPGSHAVDGNSATRWSSAYADQQWIYVDLGARTSVGRVRLSWEAAYARGYQIQLSNDNVSWWNAYENYSGDGGVDDIRFAAASARYVKVYMFQRASQWGYSLWDFEVYGP